MIEDRLKHISISGIYQSFFENHPDAVYILNLNGNYIDANPACERVFGYARSEFLRMSFPDIVAPEKLNAWRVDVTDQWQKGQSITFETSIRHRDGHFVELTITDTPMVVDGDIVGVFGVARDVTEQKYTERMLYERTERYQSLKKYNPNGICSFRLDGAVMGANPAYERITGYRLDELLQMNESRKQIYLDSEWGENGVPPQWENTEFQIHHKDGHLVNVRATSVPIYISGEQIGFYIILEDISEQKKVKTELQETQRLFRLISENSQDIVTCTEPDGTFSYVSPSVQTLLGYCPNELIGKPAVALFHTDDLPSHRNVAQEIARGENVPRFTCRTQCKNGNYRWIETAIKVIRDEHGNVVQTVGVGRDVSDQVALQESLEQAIRIAGLGHWERDLRTDQITYSSEMYRILGLNPTRSPFTFDEYQRLVHPQDYEMTDFRIKKSIATGNPLNMVYRIIRNDGEIRYLHSQAEVLLDDEGVPVRLVGTAQDVTDEKLLEMDLQESEERYRRLVENSLDGIGVFKDKKWVYMNRVGLSMFGATTEDEVIGRNYLDFLSPSHHPESEKRLELILAGGRMKPVEYTWIRSNGDVFHAEVLGSRFGDNAVQVCIRDVTERRKTDELLLRSEKLSAVGQLAAGVAHEIRNPLTALKGFTQMLHQASEGANTRYFEIMKSELERIEMILGEMLVLAKPQAMHEGRHHVELILQEVITLLSTQAILNNVIIHLDLDEQVPTVLCTESQLKQVFVNVIKNGIEAMPNGGNLYVRLRSIEDKLRIEFADEGIGIPEGQIPKLGEPFFTTKEKGTGLGLVVCQKILLAHKGSLEIASQVGKGTTVIVNLPVDADL